MATETRSGIVADLEGKIVAYGRGAQKIFGYAPGEVIGQHVAIFHPPGSDETLARLFRTAMEAGLWEEVVVLVRKGGERFRARLRVTAVRGKDREITGLAGVTQDLDAAR